MTNTTGADRPQGDAQRAAEAAWKDKTESQQRSLDVDWWQGFEDGYRAASHPVPADTGSPGTQNDAVTDPGQALASTRRDAGEAVTHEAPYVGRSTTPCCDQALPDLPNDHRTTLDPREVTCTGGPTVGSAPTDLFDAVTARLTAVLAEGHRTDSAVPFLQARRLAQETLAVTSAHEATAVDAARRQAREEGRREALGAVHAVAHLTNREVAAVAVRLAAGDLP